MLTIRPGTCAENNLQVNFEFILTLKSTSKEQEDGITEKHGNADKCSRTAVWPRYDTGHVILA